MSALIFSALRTGSKFLTIYLGTTTLKQLNPRCKNLSIDNSCTSLVNANLNICVNTSLDKFLNIYLGTTTLKQLNPRCKNLSTDNSCTSLASANSKRLCEYEFCQIFEHLCPSCKKNLILFCSLQQIQFLVEFRY